MSIRQIKLSSSQNGQILLVVVLTMIVALTVGLSIAARIVTELKLSKQNEESQRAFQAAEAGIQQTLENNAAIGVPKELGNNAVFSTQLIPDIGGAIIMNNEIEVDQAIGADVWLSKYSSNANELFTTPMGGGTSAVPIRMYWGSLNQSSCSPGVGENTAPAIEVVLLKGPITNPTISKNIYEARDASGPCGRIPGATPPNASPVPVAVNTPKVGGPQFRYHVDLTFGGTPMTNGLIMKVIPIFNSSIIGFSSSTEDFPTQGSIVESTGKSGNTVRKVVYYQSYPQLPLEIFPYSLISQ